MTRELQTIYGRLRLRFAERQRKTSNGNRRLRTATDDARTATEDFDLRKIAICGRSQTCGRRDLRKTRFADDAICDLRFADDAIAICRRRDCDLQTTRLRFAEDDANCRRRLKTTCRRRVCDLQKTTCRRSRFAEDCDF
ncbi:hypothetical protein ZOSMA_531G00060 [Zostera marina]|uniref:Uncharacterized protein n=1 Tax=Zostera marina TaxID=29655 RepID=A0A0K9NX24_ZOSMR|nr:hypothetical protein ZOSMA_531G00060 [Zostera marina]